MDPLPPLGDLVQLGYVVDDMDRAVEWWTDVMGVDRFTTLEGMEVPPEACTLRGEPYHLRLDLGIGWRGDLQIELIVPRGGPDHYTEYLDAKGPGLHHVGLIPEDFAGVADAMERSGRDIVLRGATEAPGMRFEFNYYASDVGPADYVEIIGFDAGGRAWWDSLR